MYIDKGFNSKLADKIGLTKATIITQIDYWLKRTNNVYDGKKWVYNSLKDWHKQDFHFLSLNTMINAFNSLENMGLLITGNFNKMKIDRTKWYTINYDKLAELIDEEPAKQSEPDKVVAIYPDVQVKPAKKAFTKNQNNHLPKIGKSNYKKLVKQYHKTTQEITHNINNSNSNNSQAQSVNRETDQQQPTTPTKSNKRYYEQYKKNQSAKSNYYRPFQKHIEKATDWSKNVAEKCDADMDSIQKWFADFEAQTFGTAKPQV
ncbi:MAG: hypothetical protein J6565_07590 [Lactobacillus sp.]|nr:hypothetical protein [Lactobacillus sp.]